MRMVSAVLTSSGSTAVLPGVAQSPRHQPPSSSRTTSPSRLWVNANGYEYTGPMFNIYHVSPHETENPEEFVTEVCYPVKKK